MQGFFIFTASSAGKAKVVRLCRGALVPYSILTTLYTVTPLGVVKVALSPGFLP